MVVKQYDIVLSPAGNDAWSGKLDAPIKTMTEAQERLKKQKETLHKESVTVWLRGGRYPIEKQLFFGSDDCRGVTYKAYPNETPILDASYPIHDFTEIRVHGKKVWCADLPKVTNEFLEPHQAFRADGTRLQRPRYPKTGFLYVKGVPELENPFTTAYNAGVTAMTYEKGELPNFEYPQEIQIRVFHYWKDEMLPIDHVDSENCALYFTQKSLLAMQQERSQTLGARYYADNVWEAFSDAGEFYVMRKEGKLYYIPLEEEKISDTTLYVSYSQNLMTIDHVKEGGFTFDGITFSGSDWKIEEPNGSQAASQVSNSIQIKDSDHITFCNCTFSHIGSSALGIDTGSHSIAIQNCDFYDIGANPIFIAGINGAVPDPALHIHAITITGCKIHTYGQIFYNAVGILLQYAYDCEISHNEIYDGYYTAISVGWVWGYSANLTRNIKIEYNHIYEIGQKLLSDMGGIYTLGKQPGTTIRYNLIHDIQMDSYGGWAIYPDEGSSDILIEKNVCHHVSAQPFHQHYGANNWVRNNIFAFGEGGQLLVTRKEDHISIRLEHNILVGSGTTMYAKAPEDFSMTDDSNLLWDYNGDVTSGYMDYDVTTRTYSFPKENFRLIQDMQKANLYKNAILADPLFKDPFYGDFTLAENSPAWAMGFEPIDLSTVGTRR